jgi:sigma-B regulation protein RsbU (phosphoserine phosphatase)
VSIPSLQVGGDIYDLGGKADDYQITIGDVSGKGASGAILMAVLLAGLRSITGQRKGVSETTFSLNNLMVDSTIPGKFATFFFGKLNALKNTFVYTNAGHNYPILLRADGSVEYLERGGTVLGFIRDTPYLETETELFPNDILVLYTDGLTEAYSEKDGEYEMERLERIIKKHSRESAYQIANSILVDVKNFIRPNKLQDDLTIIVLKKC